MKFRDLADLIKFFELMMIEHDVKGIVKCVSLELWDATITHDQINPINWDCAKVLTGNNGEFFVFTSSDGGESFTLVHDDGAVNGCCADLASEVVEMLEKAVAHSYIPMGLLIAISDFRVTINQVDSAENFLMVYGQEVDAALKMINLLHP